MGIIDRDYSRTAGAYRPSQNGMGDASPPAQRRVEGAYRPSTGRKRRGLAFVIVAIALMVAAVAAAYGESLTESLTTLYEEQIAGPAAVKDSEPVTQEPSLVQVEEVTEAAAPDYKSLIRADSEAAQELLLVGAILEEVEKAKVVAEAEREEREGRIFYGADGSKWYAKDCPSSTPGLTTQVIGNQPIDCSTIEQSRW